MMVGGAARALGLVVRMAVGFFMFPFFVARLGDYWYGVYFATVGLVSNFHLMDFGFANATMRQTAVGMGRSDDEHVNRTVNTALRIYVGLGVVVLLAILVLTVLAPIVISSENTRTVRVILLLVGFDLAFAFPSKSVAGIVQAKLRYDLLLVIDMLTFGLATGANVWLLLHGYGVISLAAVIAATGQLHTLLYVCLAKYLFPPLRFSWKRFDPSTWRELASYSVWSFLMHMANQLRFRIDSLTTGALFGGEAITRYAIGARIVEYAQTPLVQVSNTAMPVLTRMHATQERERTSDVVLFLLRFNLLLAVYASGLVIFLSRPFISRWMGPSHTDSYLIASLLVVGFMTEVFLMPLTNWLLASAKHKMLAIANVVEAVVNIILSIVLGRLLGLMGVALGTVLPLLVVQLFWVAPYACRSLGLSVDRFVALLAPASLSILVFAAGTTLLTGIVDRNGYVGIAAAAAALTAVYWPVVLFACLGRNDRGFIWRALALPARG